jgi:hypothetical protein
MRKSKGSNNRLKISGRFKRASWIGIGNLLLMLISGKFNPASELQIPKVVKRPAGRGFGG